MKNFVRTMYSQLPISTRMAIRSHLGSDGRYAGVPLVIMKSYKELRLHKHGPHIAPGSILNRVYTTIAASYYILKAACRKEIGRRSPHVAYANFIITYSKLDVGQCYRIYNAGKMNHSIENEKFILKMERKLPFLRYANIEKLKSCQPCKLDEKRSVAYVLHNVFPYAIGGYATRSRGIISAIKTARFDVKVVSRPGFPHDTFGHDANFYVDETEVIEGVRHYRIATPSRADTLEFPYIERSVDVLEEKLREIAPGLIMAASNYSVGIPALVAARRLGLPFIYEVRGFWEITRASKEATYESSLPFAIDEFLEAELCRGSDHVLTLTRGMKAELMRRGVPASKIAIVPNACDTDLFTPQPRSYELQIRLGIPDKVPIIGYIGSFVDYEGLDDLASACGLLKEAGFEFRLLLVGRERNTLGKRDDIESRIRKIAHHHGYGDWVIFAGKVDPMAAPEYYSLIDIAVFARKDQKVTRLVSPIKPLEAMAMEKLVIVSDLEPLRDMVIHSQTGLVARAGDIEDLRDKLLMAISDADYRRRVGANARNWVLENRTWDVVSRDLSAVMERIIST